MEKKFKYAPLSGGYMASSMIGFFISVFYVFPQSEPWGLAFSIVFASMFIASIGSMTRADPNSYIEVETKNKKLETKPVRSEKSEIEELIKEVKIEPKSNKIPGFILFLLIMIPISIAYSFYKLVTSNPDIIVLVIYTVSTVANIAFLHSMITRKKSGWKLGLAIFGVSAVLSLLVGDIGSAAFALIFMFLLSISGDYFGATD